jgi:hypothetical protein
MKFALKGMQRNSKNQQRYETKITSRVYNRLKTELATYLSVTRKGKTYEELYGIEKAAEMRAKKALPRGKQSPETIAKRQATIKSNNKVWTDEERKNARQSQLNRKEKTEKEKIAYSKKMSESKKGKSLGPKTDDHKAKLSAALKGKKVGPRSEKTKEKMRKPKSEEHKANMRKSKTPEHLAAIREAKAKKKLL